MTDISDGRVAAKSASDMAKDDVTRSQVPVILAIAFTVVCWASAFVGIRSAVKHFSAGPLGFSRYVVASIALAGWLAWTRTPIPARKDWWRLGLVGLVGITVYNLALNYGEGSVKAGSAAFLVNTAPIFTAIFAAFVLKERVTPIAYGGMVLSFAGATLIFVGEGKKVGLSAASFIVLLAAVAFSLYFILQKPLLKTYSPLQVVTGAVWIGTILMIPASLNVGKEMSHAPASSFAVLVFLGLFPGALAYVSWSFVLSRIPAAKAGSFIYCVAPVTVFIAWLWLGEVPTLLSMLGGAVALRGVVVVNTWGRK